jgi:hypothetical protein
MIIYEAIAIINAEITPPLAPSIILREVRSIVSPPNVVSIVDSSVSIETQATARLIAFDAE